jgi:ribosome assembly protein RRB1
MQNPGVIATMAETRHLNIFDAAACYRSLLSSNGSVVREPAPSKPVYVFSGHRDEGFAIDWSSVQTGRLATGDCAGNIHITNANTNGVSFTTDASAVYRGHTSSVEDIQWSPSEGTVFVSCSADKSVRIWDVRGKSGPQITVANAHSEDVNVCSWNKNVSYLLASGSDDGTFKVWDLRYIAQKRDPLANFRYHLGPITSIEWAPHDESVLCVSSADNQVTVWDLSVESEQSTASASAASAANTSNASSSNNNENDFPPQLLFIHQGQSNVKEIHHHPQIPGVIMSTAEDGFNIFKPAISAT